MLEELQICPTGSNVVYDVNPGHLDTDFSIVHFFVNNTPDDVTILNRHNVPVTVYRQSGGYCTGKHLVIRTLYQFTSKQRIIMTINAIDQISSRYKLNEDLKHVREVLTQCFKNNPNLNAATVTVERRISTTLIKDSGSVYSPDTDFLISYGQNNFDRPHPFSIDGQLVNTHAQLIQHDSTVGLNIQVVDNEQSATFRYAYICKQLVKLNPQKDPTRQSGIYVTRHYVEDGEQIANTEAYTFEEAEEKVGVFKNIDLAISGGNPEHITKATLLESEARLATLRADNVRLEEHVKTTNLEHQREISRLKHEREIEAAEAKTKQLRLETALEEQRRINDLAKEKRVDKRLEREDNYEERSYQRKDTHELIKYLPAIAIGIIAGIAIAFKKSNG